ncbi:hypothetical protein SGPA1_30396 [Streptomyces misionensis JCM 4497]
MHVLRWRRNQRRPRHPAQSRGQARLGQRGGLLPPLQPREGRPPPRRTRLAPAPQTGSAHRSGLAHHRHRPQGPALAALSPAVRRGRRHGPDRRHLSLTIRAFAHSDGRTVPGAPRAPGTARPCPRTRSRARQTYRRSAGSGHSPPGAGRRIGRAAGSPPAGMGVYGVKGECDRVHGVGLR